MTERMSVAELLARRAKQKRKRPQRVVGARRTVVDGERFDSQKEARRWGQLRLLEMAGEIAELERQVPIVLEGRDGPILTPTGKPMRYIADFRYQDRAAGRVVVEDAKSGTGKGAHRTEVYLLKRAILAAMGVEIVEV